MKFRETTLFNKIKGSSIKTGQSKINFDYCESCSSCEWMTNWQYEAIFVLQYMIDVWQSDSRQAENTLIWHMLQFLFQSRKVTIWAQYKLNLNVWQCLGHALPLFFNMKRVLKMVNGLMYIMADWFNQILSDKYKENNSSTQVTSAFFDLADRKSWFPVGYR